MGNCTSTSDPLGQAHPTTAQLVAAGYRKLGDQAAIGCGPAGTVSNYVSVNGSGFGVVSETGSCFYCSGNPGTQSNESAGCAGGSGSCAVAGKKLLVQVNSYMGDKTDCCLNNGASTLGTCDPNFLPETGQCDNEFLNYCTTGDNWSQDSKCATFLNSRGSTQPVKDAVTAYCSQDKNMNNQSAFCKSFAANNPGVMDQAVANYCAANPSNVGYCGCYSPNYGTAQSNGIKQTIWDLLSKQPQCNLKTCSANPNAYMPLNYKGSTCSPVTICNTDINASAGGNVNFSNISVTQNCSASQTNNTSNGTGSTQSGSQSSALPTSSSSSSNSSSSTSSTQVKTFLKSNETIVISVAAALIAAFFLSSVVALFADNAKNKIKIAAK